VLTVGVRWRFGPREEREIENIIIRITTTTVYDDEPQTRGVYRCPDPVTRTTGQPAMCSHNGTQSQPRYRVLRKNLLFYKIIIMPMAMMKKFNSPRFWHSQRPPLLSKIMLGAHSPTMCWPFGKLLFDTLYSILSNNRIRTIRQNSIVTNEIIII